MGKDYIIALVVGDYGGDGHNRREYEYYTCNLSSLDLEKAYKKGSKLCGLDITKYCQKYEDSSVPITEVSKLVGFNVPEIQEFIGENQFNIPDENIYLETKDFAYLYLSIAWIGNNTLEYEPLSASYIYIGGYGIT